MKNYFYFEITAFLCVHFEFRVNGRDEGESVYEEEGKLDGQNAQASAKLGEEEWRSSPLLGISFRQWR